MRFPRLIAPAFVMMTAAGLPDHAGSQGPPALECTQMFSVPDDAAPLAAELAASAPVGVEPSEAERACRSALAADPVNSTIMFLLGRALASGNKRLEAIKYYLNAAERGHAGAMNDLGGMFEYGIGVPKNLATALVWYERAAGRGHAGAMVHLGRMSENGIDIPQDFAKAREWFEKASALGSAAAMNDLANLLRQGRGGERDLSAVAHWYLRAARLGLPSAMNSVGELSQAGLGIPQDDGAALSWYEKAAALGDANAMGNLGALLESGRGGPQNLQAAREWYLKGAARNGRLAMYRLGAMFENGRGISRNPAEAKLWYERAAALEYPPALNDLGRLYLAGVAVARNYALARSWFERAADLGSADAMNNLGLLYLNGGGVQRDIKLARSWFEKAAALDNPRAQDNLKRLEHLGLLDGAHVAARRASCVQSCANLHRSYVDSVCERYSAIAEADKAERTRCIDMSLTLAKRCRESCREWAFTPSAENRCVGCLQSFIVCSVGRQPPSGERNDKPYATDSQGCLAALAECTASCEEQAAPTYGAIGADRDRPDLP